MNLYISVLALGFNAHRNFTGTGASIIVPRCALCKSFYLPGFLLQNMTLRFYLFGSLLPDSTPKQKPCIPRLIMLKSGVSRLPSIFVSTLIPFHFYIALSGFNTFDLVQVFYIITCLCLQNLNKTLFLSFLI